MADVLSLWCCYQYHHVGDACIVPTLGARAIPQFPAYALPQGVIDDDDTLFCFNCNNLAGCHWRQCQDGHDRLPVPDLAMPDRFIYL